MTQATQQLYCNVDGCFTVDSNSTTTIDETSETSSRLSWRFWRTWTGCWCFLKWWVSPTTMVFPTRNDHFGVFWGYHHLRKHPWMRRCFSFMDCILKVWQGILGTVCSNWKLGIFCTQRNKQRRIDVSNSGDGDFSGSGDASLLLIHSFRPLCR